MTRLRMKLFLTRFHHEYSCSKEEAQRCWTIDEILLVTKDSEFHNNVVMDYNLRVENTPTNESDSGYFSEEELPADEQDKVTDEYFYAHLMDGTDDDPASNKKSKNSPTALSSNTKPGIPAALNQAWTENQMKKVEDHASVRKRE